MSKRSLTIVISTEQGLAGDILDEDQQVVGVWHAQARPGGGYHFTISSQGEGGVSSEETDDLQALLAALIEAAQ